MVAFLHQVLPVQCKQCAVRFPDSTIGRNRIEVHLDLHFRQNRKAGECIGRGHSRGWYLTARVRLKIFSTLNGLFYILLQSWIKDESNVTEGKGRVDACYSFTRRTAEEEQPLQFSYVVIPPGDEAKSLHCPVCKEILKSEFLEEDEEWVWRDAVMVKDMVVILFKYSSSFICIPF